MYPAFDPLAEHHDRVARSLDAYARRERARSAPARPAFWRRLFPVIGPAPRPVHRLGRTATA